MNEAIFYNLCMDWKKKTIHPHDRAVLIQEHLKENKISQRGLAAQLEISHSTLQDWLCISRYTKEQYESLKEEGLSHTDIYRVARRQRFATIQTDEVFTILSRTNYIISKENIILTEKSKKLMREIIKRLELLIS